MRATLVLPALLAATAAAPAYAQCKSADRAVEQKLTLGAGVSETLVTQHIPLCVRHEYRLRLRAGQRIELSLTSPSQQQGMLTLVAPSGEKPVDGENAFSGAVVETGIYVVEIATDKTTTYTLRVSVR